LGQTILEKDFDSTIDKNINVSNVTKGIYFLKFISNGNIIEIKKIIVE
jgi:hypothetical protein